MQHYHFRSKSELHNTNPSRPGVTSPRSAVTVVKIAVTVSSATGSRAKIGSNRKISMVASTKELIGFFLSEEEESVAQEAALAEKPKSWA